MKRTIIFIIQLVVILITVMFLIKHQYPVSIQINDYTLTTNTSFFAAFVFIFMGFFTIVYKILEGISYAPRRIRNKIDYKKKLKGLEAVIDGLFFLSIDNNKNALKKAKVANKKIPKHVVANFLAAKAYLMDGNFEKAKKEYRKIVKSKKHMSLGFNGLIEIAALQNRENEIYTLSKQANILDKKNAYALLHLIDCQINNNEVKSAEVNIKKAKKIKAITKHEENLRLAEIAYIDAITFQEQGEKDKAIKRISPYFDLDIDYLDFYVHSLLENDQPRKAKNVVKKAWKKNPYYQIAYLWTKLGPKDKFKNVSHTKELLKDWPDSHIAFEFISKACIDAEIWGEAKDFLTKAIEADEKISHFLLMAKVEKVGFKNKDRHSYWLEKAEKAI